MNLLLFEDGQVDLLDPVTSGRPAWAVTCASYRLVDLIGRFPGKWTAVVRPFLEEVVKKDWGPLLGEIDQAEPWTLVVNGRIAPVPSSIEQLRRLASRDSAAHCFVGDSLAAAVIPTARLGDNKPSVELFERRLVDESASKPLNLELELIEGVHDYVRVNGTTFSENLDDRLDRDSWFEVVDGVFSEDMDFRLPANVACETSRGPILLSTGCQILPFVFLKGPLFIGPNNRIAEHSAIKDCVATGTNCKLGGEIEASVVESWSNKQHHGFLGHAHVGSWVNLGAGTCNSDLKHTYGTVNMQQGDRRIATGMQFVGCFIGDYAKSAINSAIYTGKRIGACSMVYGTVLEDVPPFTNYARLLGQVTEVSAAVMIQTQARMFARRGVRQRPCDIALIENLFERTAASREGLGSGPPAW